jgi:two-component system response regulator AtoC
MKILLVDDDVFLRDMYATKFGELGHAVTTAETGERALEVLESEAFDVVLLDMIMPGMTGIELLEKIGEMKLSPVPLCIVLSNQGGKEEIDAAEKAGAKGYIIKAELIPSEVVARVTKLVS